MIRGKFSTSGLHCAPIQDIDRFFEKQTGSSKKDLQIRLQQYHNARYVILFNTGFWALVSAIKLQLKRQKKPGILMPSLTYRRLADAVFWAGGVPIFCEVSAENLALGIDNVGCLLEQRDDVGAVLLVQPIVGSVDVIPMIKVCKKFGVGFIVDSVESVHDTVGGKRIGSFDVNEVFSLHASKLINGFEGGYVTTNSKEDALSLTKIRTLQENIDLDISPFHAVIANCNLSQIESFVKHNFEVYKRYTKLASKFLDGRLEILQFPIAEQCGYKNIVAKIRQSNKTARELVEYLNQKQIGARPHYQPPLHLKSYSYKTHVAQKLFFTESVGENLVNLPCGWRFDVADVDYVNQFIMDYLNG